MELSDTRERRKRKFPNFMYGSTFPRDSVGAGGPTYGGALEWMNKHQDYLNQSLQHIQRHPNLIQERVLDPFWDMLEPLIHNNNLLVKYDEFLKRQFGLKESHDLSGDKFGQQLPTPATYFKRDTDTRNSDYTYPLRRAFFCYDRTSSHHQNLKHLLVDQLEPFLSIRTNPTPEQAKVVNSLDICRSICGAVFILLLNDTVLKDVICLNLLSIAIAYKSPIILLRESGYSLPVHIADSKIVYVKVPEAAPFAPKCNDLSVNPDHKIKSLQEYLQQAAKLEDEEDVGVQIQKEKEREAKQKEIDAQLSVSLSAKVRELFKDSLVFNPQMFESTLAVLYDRLASYTGSAFPGAVPELATEAAAELSKPFNIGAMRLAEKPIYRVGSAKTTRGFHQTLLEKREAAVANLNNSNNEMCEKLGLEISESSEKEQSMEIAKVDQPQDDMDSAKRAESKSMNRPTASSSLHSHTYPAPTQNEIDSFGGRIIMVPTPPKVMRRGNMHGILNDSYRAKGFRPNYPSNSRLLKYRPNSSLPFSIRSRVMLQASIQRDTSAT